MDDGFYLSRRKREPNPSAKVKISPGGSLENVPKVCEPFDLCLMSRKVEYSLIYKFMLYWAEISIATSDNYCIILRQLACKIKQ